MLQTIEILLKAAEIVKTKPPYDAFNMILEQFGILHEKFSIENTMVPYKGLYSIHQYMKSKPFRDLFWTIKFGYKIWSLFGNDGYQYHLDVYCEKSGRPRN